MTIKHDFSLDAKYRQDEGTILLSGIQALVRLPLDQHRADKRRGLNTATLVSGYRGSPLGGLDLTMERNPDLLREHNVVFMSGVNEDLGATAIYGAQLTNLFPKPKYDGVLGMWYGKGPGVDRTGDIFKHANYAGLGKYGGVLALGGDDPMSKSSTLPTHSEIAFYDAFFPTLFPGNVQEILDLGRLGFELSRYSGVWAGFKIVTNVADELGTAQVGSDRVVIHDPGFLYEGKPWKPTQNPMLLPPFGLDLEREMHYGRMEAAKAFAAAHPINAITLPTPEAWLGIAAPGKAYYDLREALRELGLDDGALRRYGIRLLRIGMLFPMEPGIVREFGRGLQELLVIEEKRAFVELFIRDVLYNQTERPLIVGKHDEQGRSLVPAHGELDADRIAQIVARRIERKVQLPSITARVALLEALRERPAPLTLARSPFFCSGCPHNRSTVVPEGSQAGGGIGCHGMALAMPERHTVGTTHMGGEGVQWVGMAPFTDTKHMFQNLGDGTFFHSGSLAIRQAVAARTNITFKVLYNSAVAMTGGQDAAGAMPVPDMTRLLEAEGVKRIIVTTDEPGKYGKDVQWARGVEVWHRDKLNDAQLLLRDTPGVTVLIHDQRCAAEKRRLRKRGKLPDPALRVFINEAVCEGCGDCGVKSNCLSVQPVDTEYGRKTQIHQSSCNKDYSCLNGDCPSFLTVIPLGTPGKKDRRLYKIEHALPEPALRVSRPTSIFMMGIGGTGVVTVNQVLATAALLDGKHVRGLDQTGLSQKGGPVVSHLKIADESEEASNKVSAGEADCYLGFDVLVATSPVNLDHARPDKTIAVVSTSQVPTGAMVTKTDVHFPDAHGLLASINRFTRKDENVYLDALGLAETLFDDHMAANLIVLGAAYQAGAIPVSAAAIEEAIVLNGVSVTMNTHAFRAGRLLVVDPQWSKTLKPPRLAGQPAAALSAQARALTERVKADGELERLLEIRVPELIEYQNAAYAQEYVDFVERVRAAEAAAVPGDTRLSEGVARHLFKLMAYKDEYEVARLHLRPDMTQALNAQFPAGARVQYNLHPPLLRALGMKRKIKLGTWFDSAFRLLRALKGVRGTPFDPFGYAEVRRVERALIGEYRSLVDRALAGLTPGSYERAVKMANLPDVIRGYEDIKLGNVRRYRDEVRALNL